MSRKDEVLARSRAQLRIVRIAPRHSYRLVLLCDCVMWVGTHWVDGRQWLCAGTDVDACVGCRCQVSRLVGFGLVGMVTPDRIVPSLLEVSPSAWSRLEGLCRMDGLDVTCGLVVDARRPRSRAALRLEPVEHREGLRRYTERQLVDAMAVLYGLPLSRDGEDGTAWLCRVRPCTGSYLVEAMERDRARGRSSKDSVGV